VGGKGSHVVNMRISRSIESINFSHLVCEDADRRAGIRTERVRQDFDLVEKDALVSVKTNRER